MHVIPSIIKTLSSLAGSRDSWIGFHSGKNSILATYHRTNLQNYTILSCEYVRFNKQNGTTVIVPPLFCEY